ncbi:MAG: hypothetical protein D8H94_17245 [Cardiobacterium sp.]|jgi:hypothetical protein|nr:MAG: hypothetical protein D8H94_17245 [Cardiobacterium sp.]
MQRHLDDLARALEHHHWHIIATDENVPGGYSALWQICRYQRLEWRYTLVFEGLDADGILPPAKSYGCHLLEAPAISLYFSKNNPRAWRECLAAFIERLNALPPIYISYKAHRRRPYAV